MGCTAYGLKYEICTPQKWQQMKSTMNPYDVTVGDAQLANDGFVILSSETKEPIDNEYDLAEIKKQLKDNAKKRVVTISESQLHAIIKESVDRTIKKILS
jgi:hypothetical protein